MPELPNSAVSTKPSQCRGSSDRQHRAAGEAKGIKAASSRAFLPAVAPRGESSSPGARRRFSLSLRRGCARLQTSIPASASLTPVPSRRSPQTQESPAHGDELVRKNHGSNGTVYVICSVEGRACVQHVAAFAVLFYPYAFFPVPACSVLSLCYVSFPTTSCSLSRGLCFHPRFAPQLETVTRQTVTPPVGGSRLWGNFIPLEFQTCCFQLPSEKEKSIDFHSRLRKQGVLLQAQLL